MLCSGAFRTIDAKSAFAENHPTNLFPMRSSLSLLARSFLFPSSGLNLKRSIHSSSTRRQHFLNASTDTFQTRIANEDRITLVDFYADWCGPCKVLTPILKKTIDPEGKQHPNIDLVTVDIDEQNQLAAEYEIRAVPTVMAFRGGKVLDSFKGALPEQGVKRFLQTLE